MRSLLLLFAEYKFEGIRGSLVMKMNPFYVSFFVRQTAIWSWEKQMNVWIGKSQTEKLIIKSEIYMRQQNNNNSNNSRSRTLDKLGM